MSLRDLEVLSHVFEWHNKGLIIINLYVTASAPSSSAVFLCCWRYFSTGDNLELCEFRYFDRYTETGLADLTLAY